MAPEVLNPSDRHDDRCDSSKADIWSFGITLIELLRGRPPLYYLSPRAAMATIPRTSPPRLESDDPRASKTLRDLIHTCLHDDPKKRPSAGQLLKSFKSYFKQRRNSLTPGSLSRFIKSENSVHVSNTANNKNNNAPATETIYSQWDFDLSNNFVEEEEEGCSIITENADINTKSEATVSVIVTKSAVEVITEPVAKDPLVSEVSAVSVRTKFVFRKLKPPYNVSPGGWGNKDISILPIPCPSDAPNLDKILP